jgi:hypothetical protein
VRTVPLKRLGSCGIILNLVLKSFNPIEQISSLSIRILPPLGSTRRNKELIRVDLPLPVRPTTPILFPAWKVQVIPLSTKGAFGRYLTCHLMITLKISERQSNFPCLCIFYKFWSGCNVTGFTQMKIILPCNLSYLIKS